MDEILGLPGIDDDSIGDVWLKGMDKEWNVLTVHAEMEGLSKIGVFGNLLSRQRKTGAVFHTLADYAELGPHRRKHQDRHDDRTGGNSRTTGEK